MSRQPGHLLQAKSVGRRAGHQSRGLVGDVQHLRHESRGEAAVGCLLLCTTLGVDALLISLGYRILSHWKRKGIALRRRLGLSALTAAIKITWMIACIGNEFSLNGWDGTG